MHLLGKFCSQIILFSCFLFLVIVGSVAWNQDDLRVSNDQLAIRLTILSLRNGTSRGSSSYWLECVSAYHYVCGPMSACCWGWGVMNLEPCVQLTCTVSTDCLVTEHMISVLTQSCVMKAGGAHSRGLTEWLTASSQILLPIFLFH